MKLLVLYKREGSRNPSDDGYLTHEYETMSDDTNALEELGVELMSLGITMEQIHSIIPIN